MSKPKGSIKPETLHPATLLALRNSGVIVTDGIEEGMAPSRATKASRRRAKASSSQQGNRTFEPALVELVRVLRAPSPKPKPEGWAEFIADEKRHFERAASIALTKGDAEFFRQCAALVEQFGKAPTVPKMTLAAHAEFVRLNGTKTVPKTTEIATLASEMHGVSVRTDKVQDALQKLGLPFRQDRKKQTA